MRKGRAPSGALRLLSCLASLLCLGALAAAPASATYVHNGPFYEFGSDGTPASFAEYGVMAYDQSSDTLLQASPIAGFKIEGPEEVAVLGPPYPFPTQGRGSSAQLAVDNSGGPYDGTIYYAADVTYPAPAGIHAYTPSGEDGPYFGAGESEQCGIAVDSDGMIWAASRSGQLEEFAPTGGDPVQTIDLSAQGETCRLAIDLTTDDLFVVTSTGVWRYTKASGYSPASAQLFDPRTGVQLAVNSGRGVLYVASENKIIAYDIQTGDSLETILLPGYGGLQGFAVQEATDTLFMVTYWSGKIEEWRGVDAPAATTGPPTGNMTVSGNVGPDGAGDVTDCYFEYGENIEYGYSQQQPCVPAPPYSADTPVSAELPGLQDEVTYHYRLVAANANGKVFGQDMTITPHWVSQLTTEAATGVTRTAATLHASFEGTGEDTHYYFEWGTSTDYGSTSAAPPGEDAGTTTGATPLSFSLGSLQPGTTYHYRAVAANSQGTSQSADMTFTTAPAVSGVTALPATSVDRDSATLHGSFDGDGSATQYYFQWGKTQAYASKTPASPADAGSPTGTTPVSVDIGGLDPGQVYHYRLVAINSFGTTKSADMTLTTDPAVAGVTTKPASEISQESITLNGEFVGNGEDSHYYFEWGPTTAYGKTVPATPGDAGSSNGPTQVSAPISDFFGYNTYHYRVAVSNAFGTSYGQDETFATLEAALPQISGTAVSDVESTTATFSASINPGHWDTSYLFQYGTTDAYGELTPIGGPIAGDSFQAQPVSFDVDGLQPGTIYHFRVVATNFTGTVRGPDLTFKTPAQPTLDSAGVSAITQSSAQARVVVVPNLRDTTVHFEYGTSTGYGSRTADSPAVPADSGPQAVTADLSGLAPGITYHVRPVATNAIGTVVGADVTFTTAPARVIPSEPRGKSKRCKRGFVKRKGHCVRKKRHHHKHHHRKEHHHA